MEYSRTILVTDDNQLAARGLKILLEHEGFTVHVAYTGEECLLLSAQHNPWAIILDIGLPAMSGYEVAAELRRGGSESLLIALSGYGSPEDVEKATAAGFDHHLVKPASVRDIVPLLSKKTES